jgi:lipopolysaccharide biosynthesis glycosyltransferase
MVDADGLTQPRSTTAPVMHLLMCCNELYLQHLFVVLTSIAEQPTRYRYEVVIATGAADSPRLDALAATVLAPYPHMRVGFRTFIPDASLVLPTRAHYTADIFTRLWVADFFDATVERVLYLDSDMVVLGSLDPLWETGLDGRVIGAVSIPGSTRCALLGVPEAAGYFNSGVLLIDLAKWRASGAFDRLIAYIQSHHDILIDPDQDALNAVLHDDRAPLGYEWNVISPFYFPHHDLGLSAAEVARVRAQARIVHFNGASKPWSYFSRHPQRDAYFRALKLTPWRDFRPADATPANRLRRFASNLLPEPVKRLVHGLLRRLRH